MPNLNKVMIMGHLGRDPEIRQTQAGDNVANFTVAVTDKWKDKQGQKQERTEWFNITAWGYSANYAGKYLKKGDAVYVEGRQQTESWEKDGHKQSKPVLVASNITGLNPPKKDEGQRQEPQQPEMVDDSDIPF